MPLEQQSVTSLLHEWRDGDDAALERITALIYRDLRRLAAHYLNGERAGHTLGATALVHEAYLQVSGIREIDWKARGQFVAVMAQLMRRILIDYARQRKSQKRDVSLALPVSIHATEAQPLDVLVVDQALQRLSERYPRHAQGVELRFFGGLDSNEVAQVLNVSLATVERDWRFSKAWLKNVVSE